jgi:hypothetical protein
MRVRIPIHSHILMTTTKLHLMSASQALSVRSRSFPHCLELISIYIRAINIPISQTKFKLLMQQNFTPSFMIAL